MDFHGKKPITIQLDRRKPMAEARRLLKEQEGVMKKIQDGLTELEGFKAKAMAAFNAEDHKERDKWMSDIKRELKRLQRLRDLVRSWIDDAEVNKDLLQETRRSIEVQMEWFKDAEPSQVDEALKENINWYLEDPRDGQRSDDADMYADFALEDHIGKLGAHGAHACAPAEKEVLEQMQAKIKAKLGPALKKATNKKAKPEISKRAQKRAARNKAMSLKRQPFDDDAAAAQAADSDQDPSEASSGHNESKPSTGRSSRGHNTSQEEMQLGSAVLAPAYHGHGARSSNSCPQSPAALHEGLLPLEQPSDPGLARRPSSAGAHSISQGPAPNSETYMTMSEDVSDSTSVPVTPAAMHSLQDAGPSPAAADADISDATMQLKHHSWGAYLPLEEDGYRPTEQDRDFEPKTRHLQPHYRSSVRDLPPYHRAPDSLLCPSYPRAYDVPSFFDSQAFFQRCPADLLEFAITCQTGTLQQQLASLEMDARTRIHGLHCRQAVREAWQP
ncbi:hypothetical protein WJX73_002823 [Symbiochloris irregularis]|uniref:CCR4-Not complex component Not N-terminal domain-containing protein n=1 Tax=Symbiochloris irregularis TaxID=706552 RepID=A0AAW1NL93_9CHLO